jgi:phospholipid/cholesterol/gamma-HCH transport system permease protein
MLGMAVVMKSFGYPLAAVLGQIHQWVVPADLFTGLFKALVFGATVAAIGCRCGLRAGNGPRAVGEAATGAVVGGIVAMIILDGLFAVAFFIAGL